MENQTTNETNKEAVIDSIVSELRKETVTPEDLNKTVEQIDVMINALAEGAGVDPEEIKLTAKKEIEQAQKRANAIKFLINDVNEETSPETVFGAYMTADPHFDKVLESSIDKFIVETHPGSPLKYSVMSGIANFLDTYKFIKRMARSQPIKQLRMLPEVKLIIDFADKYEFLNRRTKKNFDFTEVKERLEIRCYLLAAKRFIEREENQGNYPEITIAKMKEFADLSEKAIAAEKPINAADVRIDSLIEATHEIAKFTTELISPEITNAIKAVSQIITGYAQGMEDPASLNGELEELAKESEELRLSMEQEENESGTEFSETN